MVNIAPPQASGESSERECDRPREWAADNTKISPVALHAFINNKCERPERGPLGSGVQRCAAPGRCPFLTLSLCTSTIHGIQKDKQPYRTSISRRRPRVDWFCKLRISSEHVIHSDVQCMHACYSSPPDQALFSRSGFLRPLTPTWQIKWGRVGGVEHVSSSDGCAHHARGPRCRGLPLQLSVAPAPYNPEVRPLPIRPPTSDQRGGTSFLPTRSRWLRSSPDRSRWLPRRRPKRHLADPASPPGYGRAGTPGSAGTLWWLLFSEECFFMAFPFIPSPWEYS
ncbi:hypothetical protein SKAU_G00215870 [Synaphobranchus kaupii]|uniref:Uncharacterized protein n=1 Tax=Synaphobranchus kaupii TaxID=118154 RepID=A0A9Q1FA09_SYNKA|nr:hypothetical protein SKAU_G00215870 [Synaphobranchus kaupii]